MDINTVTEIAQMAKRHSELYWKMDGYIAVGQGDNGNPEPKVQIREEHMQDIAPLSEWTLNIERGKKDFYPYQHEVMAYGVKWFTITTGLVGE